MSLRTCDGCGTQTDLNDTRTSKGWTQLVVGVLQYKDFGFTGQAINTVKQMYCPQCLPAWVGELSNDE